jgi:hypothetical protein
MMRPSTPTIEQLVLCPVFGYVGIILIRWSE